ncbi:hypothetical protein HOY82DRAFT_588917 [Tuber indicum]|nr:hypothetical protein HOY82DRAFT_588917 [Tuber indicum]
MSLQLAHHLAAPRIRLHMQHKFHTARHLANIKEVEAIWYKRNRQLEMDAKEEKDKLHREAKEEKNKLYREMINNAAENSRLQAKILKEVDEKLRLTGNFNIRGALERIVFQAKQEGIIPNSGGVQKGLNALAATEKFEEILKAVADDRGLVHDHVWDRARRLYDEVSKHAHGNDKMITIRAKDFTPAECAALVAYMSMQKKWPTNLDWIEEKSVE